MLSVIIPVYNEEKTIAQIIKKISAVNIDKEIIIVDDYSKDNTRSILKSFFQNNNIKIFFSLKNRGKGASVRTGIENAHGDFIVIQDADLEYDPEDLTKLLAIAENQEADLVLGARFKDKRRGMTIPKLGNLFLTFLFNLLFGTRFNDCLTCYKLMRREKFSNSIFKSDGFDIEMEILTYAVKNKMHIAEAAISYFPRTYRKGKKIRIKDGIWLAFRILYFRLKR